MRNRLGNCKNPYQGSPKRVLCVCSAGLLRSPTAANLLHVKYGYNTRSCGVSREYALTPIDEVLIEWADEIVFMEPAHLKAARLQFQDVDFSKKSVVLGVPDNFAFMDPELLSIIEKRYEEETGN